MDATQKLLVLVYVSSATPTLNANGLAALVRLARAYNKANGITGVLLHHDGCFMQAIEGPVAAVSTLFERIQRDRRHQGLIELHRELADRREFPFWPLVSAPDARALGLTRGAGGPRSNADPAQQTRLDSIATVFLRSFTGPRNYSDGPLP